MGLPKRLIATALIGLLGTSALAERYWQKDAGQNALLCQHNGHLGFLLDPDIPEIWSWGGYVPVPFSSRGTKVEVVPVHDAKELLRLRAVNLEVSETARKTVEFVVTVQNKKMFLTTDRPIWRSFIGLVVKRVPCEIFQRGQG